MRGGGGRAAARNQTHGSAVFGASWKAVAKQVMKKRKHAACDADDDGDDATFADAFHDEAGPADDDAVEDDDDDEEEEEEEGSRDDVDDVESVEDHASESVDAKSVVEPTAAQQADHNAKDTHRANNQRPVTSIVGCLIPECGLRGRARMCVCVCSLRVYGCVCV